MTTRRSIFPQLLSFCTVLPAIGTATPKLPSGAEILRSRDGRDWAKAFVAHVKQNPGLATDEETVATWFDNNHMHGYELGYKEGRALTPSDRAYLEQWVAHERERCDRLIAINKDLSAENERLQTFIRAGQAVRRPW